jgi:hypothetical protein
MNEAQGRYLFFISKRSNEIKGKIWDDDEREKLIESV